MWEIVSQGATPYQDVPLKDLSSTVDKEQLKRPKGCSESLWDRMLIIFMQSVILLCHNCLPMGSASQISAVHTLSQLNGYRRNNWHTPIWLEYLVVISTVMYSYIIFIYIYLYITHYIYDSPTQIIDQLIVSWYNNLCQHGHGPLPHKCHQMHRKRTNWSILEYSFFVAGIRWCLTWRIIVNILRT